MDTILEVLTVLGIAIPFAILFTLGLACFGAYLDGADSKIKRKKKKK